MFSVNHHSILHYNPNKYVNVFNCADILKYEYKYKFWLDDGAIQKKFI